MAEDIEQYRFITESLFEWDESRNYYIHVWNDFRDDTMEKAIKSYEEWKLNN